MSGCPVHSDDDADRSPRPSFSLPWDWIFLGLAIGMLTLVVSVALLFP
jgi:hypothetical protein